LLLVARHSLGVRGYLATLAGGLLGLLAAYPLVGAALGHFLFDWADACDKGPPHDMHCASWGTLGLYATAFAVIASMAGLGSGGVLRWAREPSALATSVVVAPLMWALLLLMLVGEWWLVPMDVPATLAVTVAAAVLVLARWLALRWESNARS
jgi:hypothetical protein